MHTAYSCEFAFSWVSSLFGWSNQFVYSFYVLQHDFYWCMLAVAYVHSFILASFQAAWAKASGRHNGHRTPQIWRSLKNASDKCRHWGQSIVQPFHTTIPTHLALLSRICQVVAVLISLQRYCGKDGGKLLQTALWMRIWKEKLTSTSSTYQNKISSCTIWMDWSTVSFKSCAIVGLHSNVQKIDASIYLDRPALLVLNVHCRFLPTETHWKSYDQDVLLFLLFLLAVADGSYETTQNGVFHWLTVATSLSAVAPMHLGDLSLRRTVAQYLRLLRSASMPFLRCQTQ